jgi:hypothetical protein
MNPVIGFLILLAAVIAGVLIGGSLILGIGFGLLIACVLIFIWIEIADKFDR